MAKIKTPTQIRFAHETEAFSGLDGLNYEAVESLIHTVKEIQHRNKLQRFAEKFKSWHQV